MTCPRLGLGEHTREGVGEGDGEPVSLCSPNRTASKRYCLWTWLQRGKFLSPGLSFLSLPHGVCGNLKLPEPRRSKVYSQVVGGRPAPGNKSELILSCGRQVLPSTAYLQATAHLGRSGEGRGQARLRHPCLAPGARDLAGARAGLASGPGQQKEGPLVTQPYFCPCH